MAIKTKIKRTGQANERTLNEAFDEFIIEKNANNLSPVTINEYTNSFNKFRGFVGAKTTASSLNVGVIHAWINEMKTTNKNIKAVSLNHYVRETRVFLYWCMDKGYIENSFKIKLLKEQDAPPKTYADDEQDIILERPHRDANFVEWRTFAACSWILATGNRAGTVINIRMQDLDLQNGYYELAHTKNKKAQRLPMSSELLKIAKDYINMWRKDAAPEDFLFCNIGEQKLTSSALRQAFGRYNAKRGVTKVSKNGNVIGKAHVHGLRHTFAKGYVLNGGSAFGLQKTLDHASIKTTQRYVDLYDTDLKQTIDIYSPLDTRIKSQSRTQTVQRAH